MMFWLFMKRGGLIRFGYVYIVEYFVFIRNNKLDLYIRIWREV